MPAVRWTESQMAIVDKLKADLKDANSQLSAARKVMDAVWTAKPGWIHHCHAPAILNTLWKFKFGDKLCSHTVDELPRVIMGEGANSSLVTSPGVGAAGYRYCTLCGAKHESNGSRLEEDIDKRDQARLEDPTIP